MGHEINNVRWGQPQRPSGFIQLGALASRRADKQPVWQSQRNCGLKPRVGAPRLPWEGGWSFHQPQRGCDFFQPGGLPDSSRWLSSAIPPDNMTETTAPRRGARTPHKTLAGISQKEENKSRLRDIGAKRLNATLTRHRAEFCPSNQSATSILVSTTSLTRPSLPSRGLDLGGDFLLGHRLTRLLVDSFQDLHERLGGLAPLQFVRQQVTHERRLQQAAIARLNNEGVGQIQLYRDAHDVEPCGRPRVRGFHPFGLPPSPVTSANPALVCPITMPQDLRPCQILSAQAQTPEARP